MHMDDKQNNTYTFNDLLADVIIHKNGQVEVVDLDELADAYKDGLITKSQLDMAYIFYRKKPYLLVQ